MKSWEERDSWTALHTIAGQNSNRPTRKIDLNESTTRHASNVEIICCPYLKEGFKGELRAEMKTFVPAIVVRLGWNWRIWKCLQSQFLVDSAVKISQMEI